MTKGDQKSEEVAPLPKLIPNSFTLRVWQSLPSRVKSKPAPGDLDKGGKKKSPNLFSHTGIPEFSTFLPSPGRAEGNPKLSQGGFCSCRPCCPQDEDPGLGSSPSTSWNLNWGQTGGEETGRGRNVQLGARLSVRAPVKTAGMGGEIKVMKLLINQTAPIHPPGLSSPGNVEFPTCGTAQPPLPGVTVSLTGQTLLETVQMLPRNVGFYNVWQRNLSLTTPEIPLGIQNCPGWQQGGKGKER